MCCTLQFLHAFVVPLKSLAKTHDEFHIKIAQAGSQFAAEMSVCAYTHSQYA